MHCLRYGFQIVTVSSGGSFKDGLIALLKEHPIRAILMGQRKGDPGAASLELISQRYADCDILL